MVKELKTLHVDELMDTVNLYPWYGAARKELCIRLSAGESQIADAALYLPDREAVSHLVRDTGREDYSDKDLEKLLKPTRRAIVIGGDYFSQAEYDSVRESTETLHFTPSPPQDEPEPVQAAPIEDDFCTETLALIFAEQGYYGEAIRIYSRLSLVYPEKSAYFASLIEKLRQHL